MRKVTEAANILHLGPLLERRPKELSGGQRQRVAIGRAIVRQPKVFLFDEPLSNLDAALRVQMRIELAKLHEKLDTTMIYVTHDQIEAMTMADKIVVLQGGVVEQVGSPLELYHHPRNLFVAGFIGSPKMNLLPGRVIGNTENGITVELASGNPIAVPVKGDTLRGGDEVTVGIRPEHIRLTDDGEIPGTVLVTERLGGLTFLHIQVAGDQIMVVQADGDEAASMHDNVRLERQPARLPHVRPRRSGRRAHQPPPPDRQPRRRPALGLTAPKLQESSTMYLEKFNLSGRTALITGGSRNIGLACGEALAEAGASVIVADISEELAVSGRDHLVKAGHKAQAIVLDVTKPADVNAAVDGLVKSNGAIDILVCNAGIARSDVPAEEVPDEHWLNVIDVNLNGVFWCCRAVGRHMLAKGKGSIVNVGSMSGFIVNKPQPQSYYNASKAGVHHLTKSLAAEWAERGVRVNSVAPTYIETSLTKFGMEDERMYPVWLENTPMRRVGQPEEIASVVLFLASDASSLLTGSIVLADGGYTCW